MPGGAAQVGLGDTGLAGRPDRGRGHRWSIRGPDRPVLPGEDRPGGRDHPARHDRGHRGVARRAGAAGRHRRGRRPRPGSSSSAAAPDPATYIGKGKAEELREVALELDADTVVFDDELTPAQQFNLEKLLGRTAIDRTAVILDIFAQNAHSHEGKAQVELAQLRYRLPRLRGSGARLSPAGRRHRHPRARARPSSRSTAGASCAASPSSSASCATSAVSATPSARPGTAPASPRSRSSATRTPASRRCSTGSPTPACWSRTACSPPSTPPPAASSCPAASRVLLTDTVGFVRKLPHQLVEAFKSTLELVAEADLLVHVVDASAADPTADRGRARRAGRDRGRRRPELLAFNKADLAPRPSALAARHPGSVAISARPGDGHRRPAAGRRRPPPRRRPRPSSCSCPSTGATSWPPLHREGEVLVEEPRGGRDPRPGPPRRRGSVPAGRLPPRRGRRARARP